MIKSIMLIIPKDIVFKHATVQYVSDRKPLDLKWEEFPVLINLIDLITSTDFIRLSIDLKLGINFKISVDSQPEY